MQVGTLAVSGAFSHNANTGTQLASGYTAQRPGTPALGMVRYNFDTMLFEFYANTSSTTAGWVQNLLGPITLAGDLTGITSGIGAATLTAALANSGVTSGSYGSATTVPALTVDAKGRITAATSTVIAIPGSAITDATANNTASTIVKRDASGNFSAGTVTAALAGNAATATKLATARTISITGAVTGTTAAAFDGSANATISTTLTIPVTRAYYADTFDNPQTADWAVNALAPATTDATNTALTVRAFDDTAEEGVGFTTYVPTGATKLLLRMRGRNASANTASQAASFRVYMRPLPTGAAIGSWTTYDLGSVTITANTAYYVGSSLTQITGLTSNSTYQCEFTRNAAAASDTSFGDFYMLELVAEFS